MYNMYSMCRSHMHRYVLVQTSDGREFDGIVAHVDHEHLYLAVPQAGPAQGREQNEREDGSIAQDLGGDERETEGREIDQRQFGPFGGHGYQGYGYGYPGYQQWYGHGPYGHSRPRPRRRFQQLVLPLAALVALSALPYY